MSYSPIQTVLSFIPSQTASVLEAPLHVFNLALLSLEGFRVFVFFDEIIKFLIHSDISFLTFLSYCVTNEDRTTSVILPIFSHCRHPWIAHRNSINSRGRFLRGFYLSRLAGLIFSSSGLR